MQRSKKMKLDKKKQLAANVLGVGNERVWFNPARLDEIKEAITRQDIKDLKNDGAIKIKQITGRKRNVKRKLRRGPGKKKKVVRDKMEYVLKIRKMRAYIKRLRQAGKLDSVEYNKLRRHAKSGVFTDLRHLKSHAAGK
ncbi:MAG: 50S ribosomal protein L19e [archaeon]